MSGFGTDVEILAQGCWVETRLEDPEWKQELQQGVGRGLGWCGGCGREVVAW